MKRRTLTIIAATLAVIALPSCETLTGIPVSVSYRTHLDGFDLTAGYSRKDGLSIAAEHLRILTQK